MSKGTTDMGSVIESISLDRLVGHPENPNQMSKVTFRKLVGNIERTGLYEPLIVRRHRQKEGSFEILNGHHRRKALAQLGYEKADVVVWDVSDDEARILLMTLNRLTGSDMIEKRLELLRKLNKRMKAEQLGRLLPQTASQIEKLAKLKRPTEAVKADAKDFAVPLVFFVKADQQQRIDEAIATAEQNKMELSKAARRAAALERIATSFLEKNN